MANDFVLSQVPTPINCLTPFTELGQNKLAFRDVIFSQFEAKDRIEQVEITGLRLTPKFDHGPTAVTPIFS